MKEIRGENPGYLVQRKIISKSTGQVVGYLQAFYDTTTYHRISNLLLIVLLILEIVALIAAQLIGYFMANYFMKPLEKLYQGMQEMANDPTNDFEPIEYGFSCEEACQEAGRCLRCDHFGFGAFRGGREEQW